MENIIEIYKKDFKDKINKISLKFNVSKKEALKMLQIGRELIKKEVK